MNARIGKGFTPNRKAGIRRREGFGGFGELQNPWLYGKNGEDVGASQGALGGGMGTSSGGENEEAENTNRAMLKGKRR